MELDKRQHPKQFYLSQPIFEGAQNAMIECQVGDCDWSLTGPRPILKKAWNEHYRMYHSQEVGRVAIKRLQRDELWLPTH